MTVTAEPPKVCPVCGKPTEIRQENDVLTVHCPNPECVIKKIKRFGLMTSRDALNVEGLSEATLEKLIAAGFIHEYADLFGLEQYRGQIAEMEGFGERSADNLLKAVESARNTDMTRFVYALGIPGIGLQNAKMLNRHFRGSFEAFRSASAEELCEIEGIGEVLARSVRAYLDDPENKRLTEDLLQKLHLEAPAGESSEDGENGQASLLAGKTFVITGSVTRFKNREELKRFIEDRGGKAAGSVSAKTSYLINNDKTSSSSKNKKAKELGVPVISEEDFLKMLVV